MTRVTILRTPGGEYRGYEMEGHAMQAEYGRDIVCAALSILAINTANSIESFTDDRMEVNADKKRGYLRCVSDKPLSGKGELLMSSFELGVRMISEEYGGKYVVLDFREV